jgi:nicotinamide mononucleotide transporter
MKTFSFTKPFGSLSARNNDYIVALAIAAIATVGTYLIALAFGWTTFETLNWGEVTAAAINYGATYLTIRQRRASYMLGVGASAIYAVVYGSAGLMASVVLSLYLTITLFYGFFRWGNDTDTRPVHNLQWRWLPVYIAATAALYYGAALAIQALGGSFAFWDAAILVLTLLAQLLLDQKVIQTWAVWTLVNVVGVILYFQADLHFAAMQQLIFGIANLWGFLAWRKSMQPAALTGVVQPSNAEWLATFEENDSDTPITYPFVGPPTEAFDVPRDIKENK